jgi:hypothetical protein
VERPGGRGYHAPMKCLLKLALLGLLLVGLLVAGLVVFLDTALSTAVVQGVTYVTQQETTLESVDASPLEGRLAFEGLEIANAPGFREGPLLGVSGFRAQLDPERIGDDVVRLSELVLDGLELNLELDGTSTNLDPLLARLEALRGDPGAGGEPEPGDPAPPAPEEPAEPGPEISIGRVQISGLRTRLFVSGLPYGNGDYEVAVPDTVIEDFDEEMQQATLAEWTAFLTEVLINSSLSAGEGSFPADWQSLLTGKLETGGLLNAHLAPLQQEAQEELKKFRDGLLDDPEATLEKAGEDLEKAGKDAEKALKGLFGKD